MAAPICMTKEQMTDGFAKDLMLIQEEWANPQEIAWADELLATGKAAATAWEYSDNFQCFRRHITGTKAM